MPTVAYGPADQEMVRRILLETGVATEPERPSLTSYVSALVEASIRWIAGLFADRPGLAGGLVTGALVIAIATVALALTLVVLSIVRRARSRGTRGPSVPIEFPDATPRRLDRTARRAEIEARLSRGDVGGALEAFWWWLASSLPLESGVDASWTTRELLVKARRRELLGLGGTLDGLMYGPREPSPQDVTTCLARFEEKLA